MNTEAIWESLTENGEFVVHIEDSKWKEHKIYDPDEALFDYKENELILTTVFNNNIFEDAQRIAIKNYLTHENIFYSMFIEKFLESQFVFDAWLGYDIEPYLKANDIKIPDEISLEWLKNNVKLIAININNEKDGYAFLEFDFAVSWDDEHGLRALVYKDSILAFAEGGICWSDDLDDYTERSSKIEENAHILKDKLDESKAIKNQRNITDDYEYDDWDEDDAWEEEGSESAHRFKLYDLTEIEALNNEIDESGIVSNTWWKNIKLFLSKEGIQTIGLLATKIKYITTSSLQDIDLKDRDDTLTELEKFSLILHHFHKKEENIRQVLLAFIFLLLWFYPQSIILYIFLAYYAYKWYIKYINFSKHIQWIERAKAYTKHVTIDSESTESKVTNSLDDTLTFIRYTTEQDKESWSVKLFDFIVNLFKGKR